MTSADSGLSSIGQISIAVKDVDRAIAFYRDVLGLKFLFQFPGMGFFDAGGVRLYLAIPEKPEFAGTSILYYRVSDILEAARTLEARGVVFREKPHLVHQDARHELWLGFFEDSEDNPVALMSEVPKVQA
jgi:catechol 2,3-dioxygenase-like lactoylglutathione lyase family enzyme